MRGKLTVIFFTSRFTTHLPCDPWESPLIPQKLRFLIRDVRIRRVPTQRSVLNKKGDNVLRHLAPCWVNKYQLLHRPPPPAPGFVRRWCQKPKQLGPSWYCQCRHMWASVCGWLWCPPPLFPCVPSPAGSKLHSNESARLKGVGVIRSCKGFLKSKSFKKSVAVTW